MHVYIAGDVRMNIMLHDECVSSTLPYVPFTRGLKVRLLLATLFVTWGGVQHTKCVMLLAGGFRLTAPRHLVHHALRLELYGLPLWGQDRHLAEYVALRRCKLALVDR